MTMAACSSGGDVDYGTSSSSGDDDCGTSSSSGDDDSDNRGRLYYYNS